MAGQAGRREDRADRGVGVGGGGAIAGSGGQSPPAGGRACSRKTSLRVFFEHCSWKNVTPLGNSSDFLFFLKNEMKLYIHGLMCIPPPDEESGYHFTKLKLLAHENNIKELSIGMSDDYESALKFNPTYIRLCTILFGKRS